MRKNHVTLIVGLLLCSIVALAVPHASLALTPACTPIGNTASVQYNVSGALQAPVSSNTNTITVGNKVSLTVTAQDATPGISVVPNQTGALLNFRITNSGNAKEKYLLSYKPFSGSTTSVFSGNNTVTDTFDAASAATGVASVPTTTTAVVNAGSTLDVTIIGTMPAPPLSNGDKAVYALIARAVNPTTNVLETQNSNSNIDSAFGTCTSDIVLDFESGTLDAGVPGASSARSGFNVSLTTLTVNKTSVVYSDPINGTTNPKAIPGAIMEYIVTITNPAGQGNATAVTITDDLVTSLTSTSSAWASKTGAQPSGCAGYARANIASGGWKCLDVTDTNGGTSSWGVGAGGPTQKLTATIDNLLTSQTATILYQATIQ